MMVILLCNILEFWPFVDAEKRASKRTRAATPTQKRSGREKAVMSFSAVELAHKHEI